MPDFEVVVVENAQQARALAQFRQSFSALMDPKPPRISTVELCKELQRRLEGNDGINEVPRNIIDSIINMLEAESLNRLMPGWNTIDMD